MVGQVRTGMTHEQVRYVLGTPLVKDIFHRDRWDYYYSFQPKGKKATKKLRVTVLFSGGKVSDILFGGGLKKSPRNKANAG